MKILKWILSGSLCTIYIILGKDMPIRFLLGMVIFLQFYTILSLNDMETE